MFTAILFTIGKLTQPQVSAQNQVKEWMPRAILLGSVVLSLLQCQMLPETSLPVFWHVFTQILTVTKK
jgi:hypothetical protein